MKRIFVVNNHFVYLMSKKIIDFHHFSETDVLMLSYRGYKFPEDPQCTRIPKVSYDFFPSRYYDSKRWIYSSIFLRRERFLDPIQKADAAVKGIIEDEEFALYVPHLFCFAFEVVASMQQCREINYVEEGTLSYTVSMQSDAVSNSFKKDLDLFIKRFLTKGRYGYPFQAKHYDVSLPKFRNIYCCSDKAFQSFPNKIVLGFAFEKTTDIPQDLYAIIVFDGGIIPLDQQMQSNEMFIQHFTKSHKEKVLYYKFHPGQDKTVRALFREHFDKMERKYSISIRELPDQIVLECLIASLQKKLDLYIVCSSVGLYGLIAGCNVFTTAKHFLDTTPSLRKHYNNIGYYTLSNYQEI